MILLPAFISVFLPSMFVVLPVSPLFPPLSLSLSLSFSFSLSLFLFLSLSLSIRMYTYIYIYIYIHTSCCELYVRTNTNQTTIQYQTRQWRATVRTYMTILHNHEYHMGAYVQQKPIFLACRCPCVRTACVPTYVRTHARTYRCAGINNSPLEFKIRLDPKPAGSYFILGGTPEIHNTF